MTTFLHLFGYCIYMCLFMLLGGNKYFYLIVIAPVVEEFLFRKLPIDFIKKLNKDYTFEVMVLSSVVFGLIHTDSPNGLMIQGVLGYFSALLYNRTGKYINSVILHASWNFIAVIILPLL